MTSYRAKRGTTKYLWPVWAVQRGYTLLETIITVAVSTTLLGVAAPPFSGWLQENDVHAETRNLVSLLNHARTEAIARNMGITLDTNLAAGDWSGDVTVYTDLTNNTSYDSSTDIIVRQWSARNHELTVTGDSRADDWISFGSLGQLAEDTNVARIAVCDDRGKSAGRVITINLLGRVRVDPASDYTDTQVNPSSCAVADFI